MEKIKLLKNLLAWIMLMVFASFVCANDYYISVDGSGNCSEQDPCGINYTLENIVPASNVYLAAGTYESLVPSISGTSFTSRINFVAQGDVKVNYINMNKVDSVSIHGISSKKVGQWGIDWTFDDYYRVGTYVNNDFWVIGPVKIIQISRPANTSGRDGSMINPIPHSVNQGYDARWAKYIEDLNVANLVPELTIDGNSSLVSTISRSPEVTGERVRPILQVASILTVVDNVPLADTFRPAYSGSAKIFHTSDNLRTELLLNLSPVKSTPSLATMETIFRKPWIDHITGWQGDDFHPSSNMNNYGGGIARDSNMGALRLMLDDDTIEKEKLLVRFIQLGIDDYGLVQNGAGWGWTGGTIGVGRKLPILFAGVMLDDSDMKNVSFEYDNRKIFQEDGQTFYLTQRERDGTYNPANCKAGKDYCLEGFYDNIELGTPCWGERHDKFTDSNYNYLPGKPGYRQTTFMSTRGAALMVHLMGIEDLWNHDEFLDLQDRGAQEGWGGTWGSAFMNEMWNEYRKDYGCFWTRENKTVRRSNGYYNCSDFLVSCTSRNQSCVECLNISSCENYPNGKSFGYNPCGLSCEGEIEGIECEGPDMECSTNTCLSDVAGALAQWTLGEISIVKMGGVMDRWKSSSC